MLKSSCSQSDPLRILLTGATGSLGSNVIASPHNSAQGDGSHDISLRRAVENCRRALTGEAPLHAIGLDERLI